MITSATAFICTACGMVEFRDPEATQQLHLQFQPQQQQQSQDKKK
jgi:hypothetical protein